MARAKQTAHVKSKGGKAEHESNSNQNRMATVAKGKGG
jgi:hypothetical protein